MVKKTQRRPIRAHRLLQPENQQPNAGITIKEILTLIVSSTGIFAALFWMGGRFFATGYFDAMGIPLYMLTFSAGEYGEQFFISVLILAAYATRVLGENFLLIITYLSCLLAIGIFIAWGSAKLFKKLKITNNKLNGISDKASNVIISIFIVLIFGLMLIAIFDFTLMFGRLYGFNYVITDSKAINLYSNVPIGELASFSVIQDKETSSMYKYSGLRLLTYNSGKYYLYQDVNDKTCRPQEIFIIDAAQVTSSSMAWAEPFDIPSCSFPEPASFFFESPVRMNFTDLFKLP